MNHKLYRRFALFTFATWLLIASLAGIELRYPLRMLIIIFAALLTCVVVSSVAALTR